LAGLEALVAAEEARQSAAAVGTAGHDNRIETDEAHTAPRKTLSPACESTWLQTP